MLVKPFVKLKKVKSYAQNYFLESKPILMFRCYFRTLSCRSYIPLNKTFFSVWPPAAYIYCCSDPVQAVVDD